MGWGGGLKLVSSQDLLPIIVTAKISPGTLPSDRFCPPSALKMYLPFREELILASRQPALLLGPLLLLVTTGLVSQDL